MPHAIGISNAIIDDKRHTNKEKMMRRYMFLLITVAAITVGSALVAAESIEPLNAYSEAPPQTASVQQAPAAQQNNVASTNNSTQAGSYSKSSTAIPLRLCFLPHVWYWPRGLDVYGVNLGLPISYGEGEKVHGVDMAIIASMTNGVKGIQTSLINKGYNADGGEIGVVNFATKLVGCQIGAVNSMNRSDSVQIGVINISSRSNGLQLGLLNIMPNGFLPVFPIINFSM